MKYSYEFELMPKRELFYEWVNLNLLCIKQNWNSKIQLCWNFNFRIFIDKLCTAIIFRLVKQKKIQIFTKRLKLNYSVKMKTITVMKRMMCVNSIKMVKNFGICFCFFLFHNFVKIFFSIICRFLKLFTVLFPKLQF